MHQQSCRDWINIYFHVFQTLFWSKFVTLLSSFPGNWYPILEQNSLISIPYPRPNCLKTIPFTAAYTYISYIWEYPPHPPESKNCWNTSLADWSPVVFMWCDVHGTGVRGVIARGDRKWKGEIRSLSLSLSHYPSHHHSLMPHTSHDIKTTGDESASLEIPLLWLRHQNCENVKLWDTLPNTIMNATAIIYKF